MMDSPDAKYQSLQSSIVHYLRPRPLPPLPPRPRLGGPLPLPPPLPRPGAIHIFTSKDIIFIIPKRKGGEIKENLFQKKRGNQRKYVNVYANGLC